MMKISLIIPIYNVAGYLKDCLDSVAAQTRQPDEVLLIDDGSTDGSGDMARTYAAQYSYFHYYHKANGGLSSARNFGLERMTQDDGFVAFLDSDDWLEPDFFAALSAAIGQDNADVAVCMFSDDYPNHSVVRKTGIRAGHYPIREIYPRCLAAVDFSPSACNKIYRKSLFEQVRYPEGWHFEDLATTYRLFYAARSVHVVERPLYHYRRREGSITRHFSWRAVDDRFRVLAAMRAFLVQQGIEGDLKKSYAQCYLAHAVSGSFFTVLKRSTNFTADIRAVRSKIDAEIFTVPNILSVMPLSPKLAVALLAFKLPDALLGMLYTLYRQISRKARDK